MEAWGNERANLYYEGKLPSTVRKPNETDSVQVVTNYIKGIVYCDIFCLIFIIVHVFIIDKYVRKRYVADSVPPKLSSARRSPSQETIPPLPRPQPDKMKHDITKDEGEANEGNAYSKRIEGVNPVRKSVHVDVK